MAHVHHDNASFGVAAAEALLASGLDFAAFGMNENVWPSARTRAFAARVREGGGRCR